MIHTAISAEPLDVDALIAFVGDPSCGAVASFVGAVRADPAADPSAGAVERLVYDAHPELAPRELQAIAEEAVAKWGLVDIVAVHRTGACGVGDPTVVIACAAPHRAEALDACRWVIDAIKVQVPIWKQEIYAGSRAWVAPEPD